MTLSRKTKTALAVLLLLLLAALGAGLVSFVDAVAAMPAPRSPLQKLDAIVVLTGGSNRISTGFGLLEQGYGKKLFISGVYRGLDVAQLLKRWKEAPQKNLDCCVVLGFEADNTSGNAVETAAWLRKEGFRSIYLVTADYHMKRALLEFRHFAPDVAITPFPVVPDNFNVRDWWTSSSTGLLVVHEYLKYIATAIRYLA
ncbi:MAG: YdcF family protein [Alphaproteobacteria bacterium]|nr:YdcF family protein [Alphaproteobacteria bacterium]MDE2336899.1 YdcF family protein [Alphaproteobacteria bacterium]